MPQGKAVSTEVQWIVVRMAAMISEEEIAMYTQLSSRKVRQIVSYFESNGDVCTPARARAKVHRSLSDDHINHLLRTLSSMPDIYLDETRLELEATFGKPVSISTIWRTLIAAGFTMKKLTRVAIERSAEKRANFAARIGAYHPEQLIFVDESAVDRRTVYRGKAWSIKGRAATRKAFFSQGRRYSILPALSLSEGVIHCDIIEGAFNTASFTKFIQELLGRMQPFPLQNSVIVMDNCRIHKDPEILDMIEAAGMRCEFLPPYSPDYNPIELLLSAMKYRLRRNGDYVRFAMAELSEDEIHLALIEAICATTPEDIFGWFRHCGYI